MSTGTITGVLDLIQSLAAAPKRPTAMHDDGPAHPEPSSSLLQGVRDRSPHAWQRLTNLYAPVVARWCRRAGLQDADVDNVLQEVFLAVARKVPDFHRDGPGESVHAWIYTVAQNRVRDHHRRQGRQPSAVGGSSFLERLDQQPGPADDSSSPCSDPTGRTLLTRRVLDLVRPQFEEKTWQAFWRTVIDEQDTTVVAEALGLTANAVRLYRSRVLRRLRRELAGLIASPPGQGGD
jgi:RNA polymerase sigma-70 factor (ECF subfamily)